MKQKIEVSMSGHHVANYLSNPYLLTMVELCSLLRTEQTSPTTPPEATPASNDDVKRQNSDEWPSPVVAQKPDPPKSRPVQRVKRTSECCLCLDASWQ